jgi:hypothetical protein
MIKEPNTKTNKHLVITQLLHFSNVGSFHGLANDLPIDLHYFLMVLRCHDVNGLLCGGILEIFQHSDLLRYPYLG